MYTDDVLLFIKDPVVSSPNLVSTLHIFQDLSGLVVNLSKSTALLIKFPHASISGILSRFGFAWGGKKLSYLGFKLAPSFHKMYYANYHRHTRQLLHTWAPYYISFLGRVQAVKMPILPKLLFYFRALPLYISRQMLELIQREINTFIWLCKKHCLSKMMVCRPRAMGRLGLPISKMAHPPSPYPLAPL